MKAYLLVLKAKILPGRIGTNATVQCMEVRLLVTKIGVRWEKGLEWCPHHECTVLVEVEEVWNCMAFLWEQVYCEGIL